MGYLNGEALYVMHLTSMALRGCSADNWDQLDDDTRADWDRTADLVRAFYGEVRP